MTKRSGLAFAAAMVATALSARAEVALNVIFSDHAVLQRDRAIPVYGTATPGEAVHVELAGRTADAKAGDDGKWRVELPALPAGGPFELKAGSATAHDVYVGEVWLASGQSNMEFTVSKKVKSFAGTKDEEKEIAAADHPMIRMFTVPLNTADKPVDTVTADWKVCSPETVPGFSAAGYFFARDLQQSLNVPVGIVTVAYGASAAQAWISREGLSNEPALASLLPAYEQAKADFASGAGQAKADEALKAWEAAAEKAKADGKPAPRKPGGPKDPAKDQHNPTVCYNAMIAPVEAYAVRGAIWYQGESNGIDNQRYLSLMTTLIKDWRSRRPGGPFPFIQTQLAGYKAPATQPVADSQIANVREAQRLTMTALPDAPTITAFDIGDAKNVHPKDKQEVGRRLALAARATVYGEKIEWSGPNVEQAKLDGDGIRVSFTHAKGLAVKAGGEPQGFAVLSDGKWRFADAAIEGDAIVVKLAPGEHPTELRHAWADNPTMANVVNGDGLPMLPFRSELK